MEHYAVPDFATLPPSRQVVVGARYALLGLRIVVGHPEVWGYVLAPVLLVVGAFVAGAAFIVGGIPWFLSFLWAPGPESAGWVLTLHTLVLVLLRVLLVGILLVTLYLTAGIVASPFNDRLSEHVERRMLGTKEELSGWAEFLGNLVWSVTHSIVSLCIYLACMAILMLANLLPGLGSVLGFLGSAVVSAAFFSREAMDGAFSRRKYTYTEKWRIVARFWPLTLGFGLAVSVGMAVPLLNFLVLPISVAGGTALFCHLERAGLVRRPDPSP